MFKKYLLLIFSSFSFLSAKIQQKDVTKVDLTYVMQRVHPFAMTGKTEADILSLLYQECLQDRFSKRFFIVLFEGSYILIHNTVPEDLVDFVVGLYKNKSVVLEWFYIDLKDHEDVLVLNGTEQGAQLFIYSPQLIVPSLSADVDEILRRVGA